MDATIYFNSRCTKCRQTLALLEEAGARITVIEYLKTPLDAQALDRLLGQLGLAPEAIVRTGEDTYAELGLKGKTLSRDEWLALLAAHPILVERPIVVVGDRAVVARPPERVKALLGG